MSGSLHRHSRGLKHYRSENILQLPGGKYLIKVLKIFLISRWKIYSKIKPSELITSEGLVILTVL